MAKSVIDLSTSPDVANVFEKYPKHIQPKMQRLRQLVLDTANEIAGLDKLEETLKWGEPSYLTKNGSTLRMDWKEKKPDQYAMYFKCTSKLVSTFKMMYNDTFKFETTRAIVFGLDDEIPETELKRCITMTLTYHKVKHLPMLGG